MEGEDRSRWYVRRALSDIRTSLLTREALDDFMPGVLERKSLLTMTHLWDAASWSHHRATIRWWLFIRDWPKSSILNSIRPLLSILALFTATIVCLNRLAEAYGWGKPLQLPLAPLSLQAASIGLLVVFRNNQTHDRLKEAQRALGGLGPLGREIMRELHITLQSLPSPISSPCLPPIFNFLPSLAAPKSPRNTPLYLPSVPFTPFPPSRHLLPPSPPCLPLTTLPSFAPFPLLLWHPHAHTHLPHSPHRPCPPSRAAYRPHPSLTCTRCGPSRPSARSLRLGPQDALPCHPPLARPHRQDPSPPRLGLAAAEGAAPTRRAASVTCLACKVTQGGAHQLGRFQVY